MTSSFFFFHVFLVVVVMRQCNYLIIFDIVFAAFFSFFKLFF